MILSALIKKNERFKPATPATPATQEAASAPTVATVAVTARVDPLEKAKGKVKVCVPDRRSTLPHCCRACRGGRFWTTSKDAESWCVTCHPPVDPDHVEWITAKTDLHDPQFRDAFHAFSKWLDALCPPLTEKHPKYKEAFKEFSFMDKCWLRGDLAGFRHAIENCKRAVELRQGSIL